MKRLKAKRYRRIYTIRKYQPPHAGCKTLWKDDRIHIYQTIFCTYVLWDDTKMQNLKHWGTKPDAIKYIKNQLLRREI